VFTQSKSHVLRDAVPHEIPVLPWILPHRIHAWAGCALGILAAALAFELTLRPFVAGWNQPAGRTVRSYFEGTSVAHFEPDGLGSYGNRLTGNAPLPDAPERVIVGDSHVVAQAVRDQETMGAVIERLARAARRPLNVRQYGWFSANAPTYLASADSIRRARNPAWVAVILNAPNIGVYALTTRQNWRMEVAPDDSFRLIDMRPPQPAGELRTMGRQIGRSLLALALWRRFGLIQNRASNPLPSEEIFRPNEPPDRRDPQLALEAARVPRDSAGQSLVYVLGSGPSVWAPAEGPRGTVAHHFYKSDIIGDNRDFYVYTPPGYDAKRKEPYSVLFLLHGLGDDAAAWTNVGAANVILDNLINRGAAKPMVMVNTLGYGTSDGPAGAMGAGMIPTFTRALIEEVLPQVD
jgi:hypothetical protein